MVKKSQSQNRGTKMFLKNLYCSVVKLESKVSLIQDSLGLEQLGPDHLNKAFWWLEQVNEWYLELCLKLFASLIFISKVRAAVVR